METPVNSLLSLFDGVFNVFFQFRDLLLLSYSGIFIIYKLSKSARFNSNFCFLRLVHLYLKLSPQFLPVYERFRAKLPLKRSSIPVLLSLLY